MDWIGIVNYQGFYFESNATNVKGFEYAGNQLPENIDSYRILEKVNGWYYHKYTTNIPYKVFNWFNGILGGDDDYLYEKKPYDPAEESFNQELVNNAIGFITGYSIGKLGSTLFNLVKSAGGSVWKISSFVKRGLLIEKWLGGNLPEKISRY